MLLAARLSICVVCVWLKVKGTQHTDSVVELPPETEEFRSSGSVTKHSLQSRGHHNLSDSAEVPMVDLSPCWLTLFILRFN